MSSATETARTYVNQALEAAKKTNVSEDALARALMTEAISIYKRSRTDADIANELVFLSENLSEDDEYNFMRP